MLMLKNSKRDRDLQVWITMHGGIIGTDTLQLHLYYTACLLFDIQCTLFKAQKRKEKKKQDKWPN